MTGEVPEDRAVGPVFGALADPTRRWVLTRLAGGATTTATEVAGELPMSRQAAAKHLGVLADAGLVTGERAGRETRYRLVPERLSTVGDWIAEVGTRWDERLAALDRHLSRDPD